MRPPIIIWTWLCLIPVVLWRLAWNCSFITGFYRARGAARLVLNYLFREKVPTVTAWRRYRICQECPMYDTYWDSCGHPGETTDDRQPLGCWCYLPAAVAVPQKDCWGREQDLDIGWTNDLRPPGTQ